MDTVSHWDSREYFRPSEFGDHPERMDIGLVSMLELARATAGVPFEITSAWRSKEESKAHFLGKAVDIRAKTSSTRMAIVRSLILAGFRRVGVYYKTGHVHADVNTEADGFPQDVFWVGEGR